MSSSHLAPGVLDGLDATTVGGIEPSTTPAPGGLLLLDAQGRVPAQALPNAGVPEDGSIQSGHIASLDAAKLTGTIDAQRLPEGLVYDGGQAPSGDALVIGTTDEKPLLLQSNGNAVTVSKEGWVGIGGAPSRVLEIYGTGGVDDDLMVHSYSDGTSAGILGFVRGRGTAEEPTPVEAGDILGDVNFRSRNHTVDDPERAFTSQATIRAFQSVGYGEETPNGGGYLSFYSRNRRGASGERLRIGDEESVDVRGGISQNGVLYEKVGRVNSSTNWYTVFRSGNPSAQAVAFVEVTTVYGTPSATTCRVTAMAKGDRSYTRLPAQGDAINGCNAIEFGWSGDNFQVRSTNASVYYAIRAQLYSVGGGQKWEHTWGGGW